MKHLTFFKRQDSMIKLLSFFCFVTFVFSILAPAPAHAVCKGRCCNCNSVRNAIMDEVKKHQSWLETNFWKQNVEPELKKAQATISAHLLASNALQGNLLDTQTKLGTMLTRQTEEADIALNSIPSNALCRFGTLSQDMVKRDEATSAKQRALVKASLDRQLYQPKQDQSLMSVTGDLTARYNKFRTDFCDTKSYAEGFKEICSPAKDTSVNLDIDYTRLIDTNSTIQAGDAEQAVIPMMHNLFANRIASESLLKALQNNDTKNAPDSILDLRALIAKRSVAENSFQAIVARRSEGTEKAAEHMKALLKAMGISEDSEVVKYIGAKPSYHAQMELLTKRLYQDDDFYKNLMDNPSNVSRQYAAMQSFGLMQQRDIYDSIQRAELILSLIVEMELSKVADGQSKPIGPEE
jgi:hypothetical protein